MIYFNGDSHTSGYGIDAHERYSYHVSKHFNLSEKNDSQGGASNQRIIRTTKEYLANYKPKLIIIGWTTWEREEWDYKGKFYNVNSSGYDSLDPELEQQYKNWATNQNEATLKIKSIMWHNRIWEFHQELTNQGISHVFFNCMYNFFNVDIPMDWDNKYIGPYDNNLSYYWYLQKQGFTTDHLYHYALDGHKCWAKVLVDYINKYKLL